MSVLLGILNKRGEPLTRESMARMMPQALPNCQPLRTWVDGCFGFGISQRYETPQDPLTPQPLSDVEDRLHIVGTGRLDYRDDLARKLGYPLERLDGTADIVLMQLSWRKWQQDCVQHLEGDWSMAVWNVLTQTLHLLRDATGISGLYYFDSPSCFAFSTRIDSLLRLPFVSHERNIDRFVEVLAVCRGDSSATAFGDVKRLPPASRLNVARTSPAQTEVYRALFAENQTQLDEDSYEQFVDVFEKAVQARMRSYGPVGLMLSSGYDSSAVAVAANSWAEHQGQRLAAYAAAPLDPNFEIDGRLANEAPLIRASCRLLDHIDLHLSDAADVAPTQGMIEVLKACNEPSHAVVNHYWIVSLLRQAGRSGITSMLTGQMGNATISWQGRDRRAWHDLGRWRFQISPRQVAQTTQANNLVAVAEV